MRRTLERDLELCENHNRKYNKYKECPLCEKENRLNGIQCPCCKSRKIEEGGVFSNNGIIGPGFRSQNKFPHLFCLECGVIFKNLKEKNNG